MYKSFNLENIDVSSFSIVKERKKLYHNQDHSRWVYYDNNNLYYKIWNSTYVRRDNILEGLNNGFYDDTTTPALKGLIYHEGVCRGYVMEKVNPLSDPNIIHNFYNIIKEKTAITKYFYFDYCKQHVMDFKGKPCLIDLEGIYPFINLQDFLKGEYNSSFADSNYKEFVCNIVR